MTVTRKGRVIQTGASNLGPPPPSSPSPPVSPRRKPSHAGTVGVDGRFKSESPRSQSPSTQPPAEQGFAEPMPSIRKRMRLPIRTAADARAAAVPLSMTSPRNSRDHAPTASAGQLAEGGQSTTKSGHALYVHEVLRDFFQRRPHTTLIDVFRSYDADNSGNLDVSCQAVCRRERETVLL